MLFAHVFNIGQVDEVAEAEELLGIVAEEQSLLVVCEFLALRHEVVRHLVGDGGDGARIVRAPHQLLPAYSVSSLLDGTDS